MLCTRPLSRDLGFCLSLLVFRVHLSRNSSLDHDNNIVVYTYASKGLDEAVKLVHYLLLSSGPCLSLEFHVGRPLVVLLDSVFYVAHQLSRHRVSRIDIHRACAAVFEAEPAIIAC